MSQQIDDESNDEERAFGNLMIWQIASLASSW